MHEFATRSRVARALTVYRQLLTTLTFTLHFGCRPAAAMVRVSFGNAGLPVFAIHRGAEACRTI